MALRFNNVVANLQNSVVQLGNAVTGRGGDGKYFHSSKKGELQEFKEGLHATNKDKKKDAVKKVIAAMTIGKDVSPLFTDVVNCMQTADMELKKLVYLYVINYAKLKPEMAILAVNTFRKDALDPNPLVRALAVRTMGCIRLEQILEYLVEPLRRACRDSDPYVRKTAAVCVCKLHETSPEAVMGQGFVKQLREMLDDSNAAVVSNAVAALQEISESSGQDVLQLDEAVVGKLLTALGECSEWGQVFVLDALATYTPSPALAANIVERVTARLSHANGAVVLSTVRVILRMLPLAQDESLARAVHKKLGPPLVTLLSAENELQYVALRNVGLIALRHPEALAQNVSGFFCKYNDPPYVKLEKLEVLVRLANRSNFGQILLELREYAAEVDVEFVRRTIRAIGLLAVKLECAAEKCVGVLLSLVESRVAYVVQEVFVVVRDIFRKYPGRYEGVIKQLCDALDSMDDAEAKGAFVWIVGEYAERISNSAELLGSFVANYADEPASVRLQLLTAVVKLFLKRPQKGKALATQVLQLSTEDVSDPDLRDRGFIYWRLLSTDPEAAKRVVLMDKPPIADTSCALSPQLVDTLMGQVATLAAVFYKPPAAFVTKLRTPVALSDLSTDEEDDHDLRAGGGRGDDGFFGDADNEDSSPPPRAAATDDGDILLDGGNIDGDGSGSESSGSGGTDSVPPAAQWPVLLAPNTAGTNGQSGVGIKGLVDRHRGAIRLHLACLNRSPVTIPGNSWALQVNKNPFGLAAPVATLVDFPDLQPGQAAQTSVTLEPNVNRSSSPPPEDGGLTLQVAVKNSLDVFYLQPVALPVRVLLAEREPLDKAAFKHHWERMGESKQITVMRSAPQGSLTSETVAERLQAANIFPVVYRNAEAFSTLYSCAVAVNNMVLLLELALQKNGPSVRVCVRADAPQMARLFSNAVCEILSCV